MVRLVESVVPGSKKLSASPHLNRSDSVPSASPSPEDSASVTSIASSPKFKLGLGVALLATVGVTLGVTLGAKSPQSQLGPTSNTEEEESLGGSNSLVPTYSPTPGIRGTSAPTMNVTFAPTLSPTYLEQATSTPTADLTDAPTTFGGTTPFPTDSPTEDPDATPSPTKSPEAETPPTYSPTMATGSPTLWPAPTSSPTKYPTLWPAPTSSPTKSPTLWPAPTYSPTQSPTTQAPTTSPTLLWPTEVPTPSPVVYQGAPVEGYAMMGSYYGTCSPIQGALRVYYSAGTVKVEGHVKGLPDECGSGCGIHIHEGYSCSSPTGTGGHYWPGDQASPDPWIGKNYYGSTGEDGTYLSHIGVSASGFSSFTEVAGRTITMHDSNGVRIACGEIEVEGLGQDIYAAKLVDYPGVDQVITGPLSPYPGYQGGLDVQGTISLTKVDSKQSTFAWEMSGLEDSKLGGVHIHVGKTCAEAGGHYYRYIGGNDFWTAIKYESNGDGEANSSIVITAQQGAMTFDETVGRVAVVHDSEGTRIACAELNEPTPNVHGYVMIQKDYSDEKKLHVYGTAAGGFKTGDVGGYHVHEGSTCVASGGHLLLDGEDPWAGLKYAFDTKDRIVMNDVVEGFSIEEMLGHPVVVHVPDGSPRIACGMLKGVQTVFLKAGRAEMFPYVGLISDLEGSMKVIHTQNDYVKLTGTVSGLPKNCENCGIHIHTGASCDAMTGTGGHYWQNWHTPANVKGADPWVGEGVAKYTSDDNGVASISVEVPTFKHMAQFLGRAITMHNSEGMRIGCGVIEPPTSPQRVIATSSYGSVGIDFCGNSIEMEIEMSPSATSCHEGGCGLHVHEGMTCDAHTGGHYYFSGAVVPETGAPLDPYAAVYFQSGGEVSVNYQLYSHEFDTLTRIAGRAIQTHAPNGDREGCGVLKPHGSPARLHAQLTRYPGYTGDAVTGQVEIREVGDKVLELSGTVRGLEVISPLQAIGGYHVHEGTSCEASGGHFMLGDVDPWAKLKYEVGNPVEATTTILTDQVNGFSLAAVQGRAVVVHDSNGVRVACGVLE